MTVSMYPTYDSGHRVSLKVNYEDEHPSLIFKNREAYIQGIKVYKNNIWTKILCFFGYASTMQIGAEKIYINLNSLFYHIVEGCNDKFFSNSNKVEHIHRSNLIKKKFYSETKIKRLTLTDKSIIQICKLCNYFCVATPVCAK